MTEKQLTKYKGKVVEFDFKPFEHAIYHYHCVGTLLDYETITTITHTFEITRTKTHLDFIFDLQEVKIINEDKRVKLKYASKIDTNKLFTITWNKVRFVENMKELEK